MGNMSTRHNQTIEQTTTEKAIKLCSTHILIRNQVGNMAAVFLLFCWLIVFDFVRHYGPVYIWICLGFWYFFLLHIFARFIWPRNYHDEFIFSSVSMLLLTEVSSVVNTSICVDLIYHLYGYRYKLTVYKTFVFRNSYKGLYIVVIHYI